MSAECNWAETHDFKIEVTIVNASVLVPFSARLVAAMKQLHALCISAVCGQTKVPKISLPEISIDIELRIIPPWPGELTHQSMMTDWSQKMNQVV